MRRQAFQYGEIRDEHDNIIQAGSYGKKSPFANKDNTAILDYIINNFQALFDMISGAYVYVDTEESLPETGDEFKFYVTKDDGKTYRWDGEGYVLVAASVDGLSAYEIAVQKGFEGSEDEWLQSLGNPITSAQVDNEGYMILQLQDGTQVNTPLQPIIDALQYRDDAQQSANQAAQSETNTAKSEQAAKASETNAKESETNAAESESATKQYYDEIMAKAEAVDEAMTAAQQSEANSKESETNAANSAIQASESAASIEGDTEIAQQAAQSASESAQAAKASETNAASSESSAKSHSIKAESAAQSAGQSASEASSSAATASQSASSAKQDAEEIANNIDTAVNKASEAMNSATNASASASQAKTSETNAASSASNASASEQKAKEYADKVQEVVDGLSSAYTYMGSVNTYDDLPTENQKKGYMYNIINADKENQIKAGDNVVWNGESWDNLSGYVDLSDYAKKTELPDKVSELVNDAGYITTSSDITGNAATATNVEWNGVTGKPSTYPPGSHKHSAGDVTGLSAVATTGSYNDLTDKPEQLPDNVVTWDFGTDNAINGVILNNGTISFSPLPEGPTTGIDVGGRIISNVYNATKANDAVNKSQLDKKFDRDDVTDTATANKVLRLDSNSKLPADITGNAATATTANAVAWDNVSGKPSAFTPASHTHDASTIAGLSEVATSGNYNDLIGTPTILTQTQVQEWINSAINNITNGDEVAY